jgi:hypothetical protein
MTKSVYGISRPGTATSTSVHISVALTELEKRNRPFELLLAAVNVHDRIVNIVESIIMNLDARRNFDHDHRVPKPQEGEEREESLIRHTDMT